MDDGVAGELDAQGHVAAEDAVGDPAAVGKSCFFDAEDEVGFFSGARDDEVSGTDERDALSLERRGIDLPRADGLKQFAWVMPNVEERADRPWVLYLHGNAATISHRTNIYRYEQLRALGVNVFAPEYRGYGGLEGVPSERGLYADARVGYDYLRTTKRIPADRIIAHHNRLLGSGFAELATADEVTF